MNFRRIIPLVITSHILLGLAVFGQGIRNDAQQPAPPPTKVESAKAPGSAAEAGLGQAVDSRS